MDVKSEYIYILCRAQEYLQNASVPDLREVTDEMLLKVAEQVFNMFLCLILGVYFFLYENQLELMKTFYQLFLSLICSTFQPLYFLTSSAEFSFGSAVEEKESNRNNNKIGMRFNNFLEVCSSLVIFYCKGGLI